MKDRRVNRAAAALWVTALVMGVSFCSSAGQKAMDRSSQLVDALKKQSIPGLPATLTPEQAIEIDQARSGPGQWFVEKGCFACHAVSVYNVKSYAQIGPDLSTAVDDVKSRFGKSLDEFWKEPMGTMMMVRSQLIKLTPDEQALALQKLKDANAEYKRKQGK